MTKPDPTPAAAEARPPRPGPLRRRWLRRAAATVSGLVGVLALGYGALTVAAWRASGSRAEGARLERLQRSPQWKDGRFTNRMPRVDGPALEMTKEWFTGGSEHREPKVPLAVVSRRGSEFPVTPEPGVAVTWLGHSTLLVDVDGYRVLIDPVWGERASPFSFLGPKRFFAPPLPLAELPRVDVILISHDHYDHLDTPTVVALAKRDLKWVVPLGVGAHLEYWGVPMERITEPDWWEETRVRDLTLTATPARHFSGRSVAFTDADCTLWSGWALTTPSHRVFYSGDTAMFDGFIDIGKRLGPFDLTMLEVGAYDRLWRDVHLGPEQAVRAHRLVRGKVLLPVHWGLFDLALHGFTEPIERVLVAAKAEGVDAIAPRPGETVHLDRRKDIPRWWPDVPWVPVEKHDARSTGVDHLLGPQLPPGVEP